MMNKLLTNYFYIFLLVMMGALSCSIDESKDTPGLEADNNNSEKEISMPQEFTSGPKPVIPAYEPPSTKIPAKTPINKKVVESRCEGACIRGYISHGMELFFSSLEKEGEQANTFQFRDAEDLGDRFDLAFIQPVLKSLYPSGSVSIKVEYMPNVLRSNFAAGFEIFIEGIQAYDSLVTDKDGNFLIDHIQFIEERGFKIRLTKNFSIKLTNQQSKEVRYQCLTVEHISQVDVLEPQQNITYLPKINTFTFYYHKTDQPCIKPEPDTDKDGVPDNIDTDDDNDGVLDENDCALSDNSKWQAGMFHIDQDGDGLGGGGLVSVCYGKEAIGYSDLDTDCNDLDKEVFELINYFIDQDLDGYGGIETQDVCSGFTIPLGYSENSSDCDDENTHIFQILPYLHVDLDADGYSITKEGNICTNDQLPSGYLIEKSETDCNDNNNYAYQLLKGFKDSDNDGLGEGQVISLCSGESLPKRYAKLSGDCDDNSKEKYQVLPYLYLDQDQDGFFIKSPGKVCTGEILPNGYSNTSFKIDCNDKNEHLFEFKEGYLDQDGDGIGSGDLTNICSGEKLPPGFSLISGDCDDFNIEIFKNISAFIDSDGDGHTVGEKITICTNGNLPPGWALSSKGEDCYDMDKSKFMYIEGYQDKDSDGITTGSKKTFCSDGNLPAGYTAIKNGNDCNDNDKKLFQILEYAYIDQDRDSFFINKEGSICTAQELPDYLKKLSPTPVNLDCDDFNPNLFSTNMLLEDKDGDGYSVGEILTTCGNNVIPLGFVPLDNAVGVDCNDENSLKYDEVAALVDNDADGYTQGTSILLCIGDSLPAGYTKQSQGEDCNDSNSELFRMVNVYQDKDGDGFTVGDPQRLCANTAPKSMAIGTKGNDCDDSNQQAFYLQSYNYVDMDGDGYTIPSRGILCSNNSLPEGYLRSPNGRDCDDNNLEVFILQKGYFDQDLDGYGAGFDKEYCSDGTPPPGIVFNENDLFPTEPDKYNLETLKTLGGSTDLQLNSVTTDNMGNIYLCGHFASAITIDNDGSQERLGSTGSTDVFIVRYDQGGGLGWIKSFKGSSLLHGKSIETDNKGNVYVGSHFEGTAYFGDGIHKVTHQSNGGTDAAISKLNQLGDHLWTTTFGGSSNEYLYSIKVDSTGNTFVLFRSATLKLVKIDSSGSELWEVALAGNVSGPNAPRSLALDSQDNAYITGYFSSTVNFSPNPSSDFHTSNGQNDIFVTKISASGSYGWTKTFGSLKNDKGQALTITLQDEIFLTGQVGASLSLTFSGSGDFYYVVQDSVFLIKADVFGKSDWGKVLWSGDIRANSIAHDKNGNLTLIGSYQNTIDFDISSTEDIKSSKGGYDVFISGLTSDGTYQWSISLGGNDADWGTDIVYDPFGQVIFGGHFMSNFKVGSGSKAINIISDGGLDGVWGRF